MLCACGHTTPGLARPSQYGSGALTLLITPFPAAETPSYTSHSRSSPLPLGYLDGNTPWPTGAYGPEAVPPDPLAVPIAVGADKPAAPFSDGATSKAVEAADNDDEAGRRMGSRSTGLDITSPALPAEASSQKILPPPPPLLPPLPLGYPARPLLALLASLQLLLPLPLPPPLPPQLMYHKRLLMVAQTLRWQ